MLGRTIPEKIPSRASGRDDASAGEIVVARVSFLMTNDAVGELTVRAFEQLGGNPWDRERIAVVLDHYIPATTENAARVHKLLRDFCRKYGIRVFDQEGVCHQLMLENPVVPGDVAKDPGNDTNIDRREIAGSCSSERHHSEGDW